MPIFLWLNCAWQTVLESEVQSKSESDLLLFENSSSSLVIAVCHYWCCPIRSWWVDCTVEILSIEGTTKSLEVADWETCIQWRPSPLCHNGVQDSPPTCQASIHRKVPPGQWEEEFS